MAVVAAVVLVAVSCSGSSDRASSPTPPTPARPTLVAPTTSPTVVPPAVGDVAFAHLFSPSLAVVASGDPGGGRVLLTTDGHVWRDVTPPASSSHGAPLVVDDAVFADAQHGWATTWDPATTEVSAWRTADGGATWTVESDVASHSMAAGADALLSFINDNQGWMTVLEPTAPIGRLFRTADGGITWVAVNTRLPALGLASFADSSEGWLAGADSCDAYATHDGGATWAKVKVAFPPGEGNSAANGFGPVLVLAPGRALLGVEAVEANTEFVVVYETSDGGRHWALRSAPPAFGADYGSVETCDPISRVSLAGASEWWALSRDLQGWVLHRTGDSGRSWTPSRPTGLPSPSTGSAVSVSLQAVDADHAWLSVPTGRGTELFATADGGATWSQLTIATPAVEPPRCTSAGAVAGVSPRFPAFVPTSAIACSYAASGVDLLAAGGGAAWTTVSFNNPDLHPCAQLVRLGADARPTAVTGSDGCPIALAYGLGRLWMLATDGDASGVHLVEIDPGTERVLGDTPLGGGTVQPGSIVPLTVGDGAVWAAIAGTTTVTAINAATGATETKVVLPATPVDLAADTSGLWALLAGGRLVRVVDGAATSVAQVAVPGPLAGHLVANAGTVWVAGTTTSRVDEHTGRLTATGLDEIGVMAVGDGEVWVAGDYGPDPSIASHGLVAELSPDGVTIQRALRLPTLMNSGPSYLAVADGAVWTLNTFTGTVTRLVG